MEPPTEPRVGALIKEVEGGSARASEQLFAALYGELHRLAERQLRRSGNDLSLDATTLVHEVYLDMAQREGVGFPDRARFMGYAARAMRGVVIDYARRAKAQKRGGGQAEITLSTDVVAAHGALAADLERLCEALDELEAREPGLAEVVDLNFFCGYSFAEIAELRGVSERTVQRDWRKARLLLQATMGAEGEGA